MAPHYMRLPGFARHAMPSWRDQQRRRATGRWPRRSPHIPIHHLTRLFSCVTTSTLHNWQPMPGNSIMPGFAKMGNSPHRLLSFRWVQPLPSSLPRLRRSSSWTLPSPLPLLRRSLSRQPMPGNSIMPGFAKMGNSLHRPLLSRRVVQPLPSSLPRLRRFSSWTHPPPSPQQRRSPSPTLPSPLQPQRRSSSPTPPSPLLQQRRSSSPTLPSPSPPRRRASSPKLPPPPPPQRRS